MGTICKDASRVTQSWRTSATGVAVLHGCAFVDFVIGWEVSMAHRRSPVARDGTDWGVGGIEIGCLRDGDWRSCRGSDHVWDGACRSNKRKQSTPTPEFMKRSRKKKVVCIHFVRLATLVSKVRNLVSRIRDTLQHSWCQDWRYVGQNYENQTPWVGPSDFFFPVSILTSNPAPASVDHSRVFELVARPRFHISYRHMNVCVYTRNPTT